MARHARAVTPVVKTKGRQPTAGARLRTPGRAATMRRQPDTPARAARRLSRQVGDEAAQRVLRTVQTKVVVGRANDPQEQEADRVAARVASGAAAAPAIRRLQRQEEEESQPLRRADEEPTQTLRRQAEEEQVQTLRRQAEEEPAQTLQRQEEETQTLRRQGKEEPVQPLRRQAEEEPVQTIRRQEEEAQPLRRADDEEPAQTLRRQAEEEQVQTLRRQAEEEPAQTLQRQEEETQTLRRQGEEEPVQPLRRQAEEETEEEPVQTVRRQAEEEPTRSLRRKEAGREGGPVSDPALAARISSPAEGRALPEGVQKRMEPKLSADFSAVRVHDTAQDQADVRALGARAFAKGSHVWLGRGESASDSKLMAHELTHVVQQNGARPKSEPQRLQRQSAPTGEPANGLRPSPSGSPSSTQTDAPPQLDTKAAKPEVTSTEPGAKVQAGEQRTSIPGDESLRPAGPKPPRNVDRKGAEPSTPKQSPVGPPAAAKADAAPPPTGGAVPPAGTAPAGPDQGEVAAPTLSGGASAAFGQLATLSPIRRPAAYLAFSAQVTASLGEVRNKQGANPPKLMYQPNAGKTSGARKAAKVRPPRATGRVPGLQSESGAVERIKPHEHSGASPRVRNVEDPGPQLERAEKSGVEKAYEWLRGWLGRFFRGVPATDTGADTDPGPPPKAKLTGKADPAQMGRLTGAGANKLVAEKISRDEEANEDFGELNIFAEQEEEEIAGKPKPWEQKTGAGCDTASEQPTLNFDPDDEREITDKVAPKQAAEYEEQRARVVEAEGDRDTQLVQAEADARRAAAEKHAASHREQKTATAANAAKIAAQRIEWVGQNRAITRRYDSDTASMQTETQGAIAERRTGVDAQVGRKYSATRSEAEQRHRETESEARNAKSESEKESGDWFSRGISWIKDKARSAARWVADKVKGLFAKFRAWVKKKFDELKAWAVEQIEKARRWIVKKLEQFRNKLNGLVDKYLGQYPAVASYFKRKINAAVDATQNVVNVAAEGLRKAVSFVIDMWAAAADAALGFAEGLIIGAVELACGLVVTGANWIQYEVKKDLESLIIFVRELPEPDMLGSMWVIAKLALLGFLEGLRDQSAERKKLYSKKVKSLATSLGFYGGILAGAVKGFVWDGFVGFLRSIWDLITGIPKAIYGVVNYFREILSDTESWKGIVAAAGEVEDEISRFMEKPDAIDKIVEFIRRSPGILQGMVDQALKAGKKAAYQKGAEVANNLYDWVLTKTPLDIGFGVGSIIGQIVFEVLATVFTGGAALGIKVAGKALRVIMKVANIVLGRIQKIFRFISRIIGKGFAIARKVGKALAGVLQKAQVVVMKILRWLSKPFRKAGGKGKGAKPEKKRTDRDDDDKGGPQWAAFVAKVRAEAAKHPDGIAKAKARTEVSTIWRRHRKGVGKPKIKVVKGFYEVRARRKGGLGGFVRREVVRFVMEKPKRWKRGVAAVKKSLRTRLDEKDISTPGITNFLGRRLKADYSFKSLYAKWDNQENDWNIIAGMSPDKQIDEVHNVKGLHFGSYRDPIPIYWYKDLDDYVDPIHLYIGGQRRPVKKVSTTWVTVRGEEHRIGIDNKWNVPENRRLLRETTPRGGVAAKFKRVLRALRFNWRKRHADHVTDLGFRGPDKFENLWPLKQSVNVIAFKGKWYTKYKVEYKISNSTKDLKTIKNLKDRDSPFWFKVIGFKHTPPSKPGGRD